MNLVVVILAAGKSTRFVSRIPKVLHLLGERPMIAYAIDVATQVTATPPVIVAAPDSEEAIRAVGGERVRYVVQQEARGAGHAALQARALLEGAAEHVLILSADMPLVQADTLRGLAEQHVAQQAAVTILTTGEKRADTAVFAAATLWPLLEQLEPDPRTGEYTLSGVIALAATAGKRVQTVSVADPDEAIGVNTRVDLARAEAALRRRIHERWMLAGVTLIDPASTYIGADVTIGQDTVIQPNTHLRGATTIGAGCVIGPNSLIEGCTIGDRCVVLASVLEYAVMEEDSNIGPFSHLRKGARVCRGAHVGNFGEIKNSTLGPNAKMGHFSYLGDAQVGEDVNIGAGTITCNFDGERKHPTVIEDGVFIGSDSLLVAPLHIGAGAKTGAGSVVTHDVPARTVVYGVPARVRKQLDESPPKHTEDKNLSAD